MRHHGCLEALLCSQLTLRPARRRSMLWQSLHVESEPELICSGVCTLHDSMLTSYLHTFSLENGSSLDVT